MTNSKRWSLRASLGALLLALCLPLSAEAQASGCPSLPVAEQGGMHLCIDTGNRGHVHAWYPSGFDPASGVTVVYVHGYNNDEQTNGVRRQDGSYIDRAWTSHNLAQQFAASRLNALFIAPEGPIGNKSEIDDDSRYASVKWSSLGSLLDAVKGKVSVGVPQTVTAMGHSAGMFTVNFLQADARVTHVVTLDSMYTRSSVKAWFEQGGGRKLTLVGGGGQNAESADLAKELGFGDAKAVLGIPAALTQDQIAASGLYINSRVRHMEVVTGGRAIPLALSRSGAASSEGDAGGAAGSGSGQGLVTAEAPPATFTAPRLEIPIPGLRLSDAVRRDGTITVPFLAEYISGIYNFLISIVGVVAAVYIMVGGFQYLIARGDSSAITKAKERITNALVGLMLALGSYVILYTINPKLVSFGGLQYAAIHTEYYNPEEFDDSGTQEVHGTGAADAPATTPEGGPANRPSALCGDHATCKAKCEAWRADPNSIPSATAGMASVQATVVIQDSPGVIGNEKRTTQHAAALLRNAGQLLSRQHPGYNIVVTSGYRDLAGQMQVACAAYARGDDNAVGHTIAFPGGSFHGIGYALDVQLWNGRPGRERCLNDPRCLVLSGSSRGQNNARWQAGAELLEEIMIASGFRRLSNEIWHYEPADGPKVGCRCYTTAECPFPAHC